MTEKLEPVKRLHMFDRRLANINRDLKLLPRRLEEIRASFSAQQERIEGLERRRERLTITRKQKNEFLEQERGHLQALENKQMQVTNERQAEAVMREIESSKRLISNVEEEVLRFDADIEDVDGRITELRKEIDEGLAEFSDEIAEIEKKIEDRKAELESKQAERGELTARVDPATLSKYERIRANQEFALAVVRDDLCHACFMHLPPQLFNQVQRGEEIQLCPSCHRILVLPDDELVAVEEEVAEKMRGPAAPQPAAEEVLEEAGSEQQSG